MPGHNQMKLAILGFCGIKPVKISSVGSVKGSTLQKRKKWLKQAYSFGFNA
jgi:hypothetical protein